MIFNHQIITSTNQQIITLNTISIIIAIYNRKDELFELLNSLSHQTDKDFEVIIVDDGSLINLRPTAELFQESLNIEFFRKDNSGPGLSRNYGAKRANPDPENFRDYRENWLVFVDSDVIVETDYIQNIKKNLTEIPCDAFGGADKAHKGFNLMQKAISYSMTSVFTTGGIRGSKTAVTKFQPRSFNMGVRKSAFEKVGGFSEMRIGEDPDLSMKLWENSFTTAFFDNIGVYHKRRVDFGKFSKQVYQAKHLRKCFCSFLVLVETLFSTNPNTPYTSGWSPLFHPYRMIVRVVDLANCSSRASRHPELYP